MIFAAVTTPRILRRIGETVRDYGEDKCLICCFVVIWSKMVTQSIADISSYGVIFYQKWIK